MERERESKRGSIGGESDMRRRGSRRQEEDRPLGVHWRDWGESRQEQRLSGEVTSGLDSPDHCRPQRLRGGRGGCVQGRSQQVASHR